MNHNGIPIPYARFRPKTCEDGSHWMRALQTPTGEKVWRCVSCPAERPYRTALFTKEA
jgi:hypothetical protein